MSSLGFVDVATAAAGSGSTSIPNLGTFALLSGPAVGPDGTVYVASLQGTVWAMHPDGSASWHRQLHGEEVRSAPAVASDGTIYVVGLRPSGAPGAVQRLNPTLHIFSAGGGQQTTSGFAFPQHGTGATNVGAPAVWEFGGAQAVIVPVLYFVLGGAEFRLLAFGPSGQLLDDALVSNWFSGDAHGSGWQQLWDALFELLAASFSPGRFQTPPDPPYPGAGIAIHPQGGTPWVVVCDRPNRAVAGFTFAVGPGSLPRPGFFPRFTTTFERRTLCSAPGFLWDLHSVVGTDVGVLFSGPTPTATPASPNELHAVFATPSRAAGGRTVIVDTDGHVVALHQNGAVSTRVKVAGLTLASAAASASHVYVSTTDGLYTLDAAASTIVKTFPWQGGGLSSPVVGPHGHVYAMASDILFVFPPPRHRGPGDGPPGAGSERVMNS